MAWLLGGPSLPWVFANSQGLKAAHIFCSTYRVLKVAHLTSSASSPQISSHMVPCVCLSPPELLKTHILHNPGVLKVYEGLSGTGTRHDFHIQNWPNRNCIEHRVCRAAWSNHSCRTIVKPESIEHATDLDRDWYRPGYWVLLRAHETKPCTTHNN